jgi:hypothetical protein
MITGNHTSPPLSYTERRPWRPTRHPLAPYYGNANILCTWHEDDALWWTDSMAAFRCAAPDYLRRAYLNAGLPTDTVVPRLPLAPIEALALLGPRLDDPVACYRVIPDADTAIIPVDVFATGDPVLPEIHIDARYIAYALDQFQGCSFWRLHDSGIAVRDRQGFQIVGIIWSREPRPAHTTEDTP